MPAPVLVVDDHRTLADLMRLGLDAQADLRCAAVAYSAAEARRIAAAVPFAAAIVDLGLPDADGAQLVGELRQINPDARIVILTAHPRSDLARRAIAAGAQTVLPKTGRLDDVLTAVRSPIVEESPSFADTPLTTRELEVLTLLADGLDVQSIAERLALSLYTVRDHVKAILAKLGVRTQLEAVVAAAHAGIIVLESR